MCALICTNACTGALAGTTGGHGRAAGPSMVCAAVYLGRGCAAGYVATPVTQLTQALHCRVCVSLLLTAGLSYVGPVVCVSVSFFTQVLGTWLADGCSRYAAAQLWPCGVGGTVCVSPLHPVLHFNNSGDLCLLQQPSAPCGCSPTQLLWVLLIVYKIDRVQKLGFGSVLV